MALQLPFGLHEVDFTLVDAAGALDGSPIGNIEPISIDASYQSDTQQIAAADQTLEQRESNERINLTLVTAGWPLAFLAAIEGTVVDTTGSGATLKSVVKKNVVSNQRPFGRLRALSNDKAGGSTFYVFPNASASGSASWNAGQSDYTKPSQAIVAYPVQTADAGTSSVVGDLWYYGQMGTQIALTDLADDVDEITAA